MNDGKGWRSGSLNLVLIALALAGCNVGPDYRPPQTTLPTDWSEKIAGGATTQPVAVVQWWKTFNDPVLDALVHRAVQSNLDLRIAASRIREARAQRRIVVSGEWPTINASGSYQRTKGSENSGFANAAALGGSNATGGAGTTAIPATGFNPAIFSAERSLWQLGFDASWELDVFGGIRRAVEAADADIGTAIEGRRDVLVSLLAEVAANYLDLRGIQQQIDITTANVKSQQDTVELTRTRFNAGLTGELDVVRAEAQVATTAAILPILQTSARRAIHRIGVLTGQLPGSLSDELSKVSPMPPTPPAIPVGLPSDLLRRRADIRRAERQLAAATARIGVATADLFPKFTLTGGIGLQSDKAKSLFNSSSNFWSIGPGVRLPIFDRGRIRARIRVEDERTSQSLDLYENTVLLAMEEVENSLVSYAHQQTRRQSLANAVKANRRAVDLAKKLYTSGLARPGFPGFLDVLDAQRTLYISEEQLVISERAVATDLVALYKALGGGWEDSDTPPNQQTPKEAPQ